MNRLINRFNHRMTRLEALEASSKAPFRRIVVPAGAIILGGYVLASDLKQAPTSSQKRQVAIRDLSVVGGTLAGLMGGIAFAKSRGGLYLALLLSKLSRKPFIPSEMPLSRATMQAIQDKPWATGIKEKLKQGTGQHSHGHSHEAHGGHSHGDHAHGHGDTPSKLIEKLPIAKQINELFNIKHHDHGIPAIVWLETLAAGSILGAVGAGGIADKINGEDLRKTMPAKLYESIFQFMGNITVCTVSILLGSWLGRGAGRLLLKNTSFDKTLQNRLLKQLQDLAKDAKTDLRRVPISFTERFEQATQGGLKTAERRKNFIHQVVDWHGDLYPDATSAERSAFKDALKAQLDKSPEDISALRKISQQHISGSLYQRLQHFKSLSSPQAISEPAIREALHEISHYRFENQFKQLGMLGGFIMGIVGGAYTSNQLNAFLQKHFHLAKPEYQTALVNPSHHRKGLLNDKLGDRGIHWWDMILHLDDLPSALYLAGVEVLEPFIRVLYGMSGYLSGIAGTNYSEIPHEHHTNPSKEQFKYNFPGSYPAPEALNPLKQNPFQTMPLPTYTTSPSPYDESGWKVPIKAS
ncbi:MAG: hypothetical protein VKJ04_03135 [Vampirovibrionales bacterium]|nr:hypothetical protein [Vampirovibrionales bacterium]